MTRRVEWKPLFAAVERPRAGRCGGVSTGGSVLCPGHRRPAHPPRRDPRATSEPSATSALSAPRWPDRLSKPIAHKNRVHPPSIPGLETREGETNE